MNGKLQGSRYLALALIAARAGEQEACWQYMSQAAEFGDDLTQFVDEVRRIGNTATRNDVSTSEQENTLAPSLQIATASATAALKQAASELSYHVALSSMIDEGDELDEMPALAVDADEDGSEDFDVFIESTGIGPVRLS